ncbi:MAG TPA: K(+)-transporting ATPase subunit F [Acidimicrobiales bacterium]|nr:K(+)-transporting ATPase subunit F [Acidimicrobiales bacterium]
MSIVEATLLALAVGLLAYLVVALVRPEWF